MPNELTEMDPHIRELIDNANAEREMHASVYEERFRRAGCHVELSRLQELIDNANTERETIQDKRERAFHAMECYKSGCLELGDKLWPQLKGEDMDNRDPHTGASMSYTGNPKGVPTQQAVIGERLNNINEAQQRVAEKIEMLYERLAPILQPSSPGIPCNGVGTGIGLESPHASQLADIATGINGAAGRLTDILNRLDL